MQIGNYHIIEYLGNITENVPIHPGILSGNKTSYAIKVGIIGTYNIRKVSEENKDYKVSDDLLIDFNDKFDFIKVSLVSDFSHSTDDIKFDFGVIKTELISSSSGVKPYVYSIAPIKVNKTVKVNKKFGVDPSIKLTEVELSGISYAYEREYEELHPQIEGHFDAAQEASWKYNTVPGVDDITGAQIVEFIVKQPKNTISQWRVYPDGEFRWANFKNSARAFFKREKLPEIQQKFQTFSVPFD